MSRIALIGGHGKVALILTPLLAGAGHTVSSIIRNPDHSADVATAGGTPVVADIENLSTEEISALFDDHDTVIWSAGAGGGNPARTYAVDRDAAIRSVDAAERAGVRRYVMVSYFGAGKNHGLSPDHGMFPYAEAKAAADEHLRASTLAWTVLGPSALTLDPPTGLIDVTATEAGSVPRADVAAVIAAVVERDSTSGLTIRFNSGSTPIAEALDSL